MTIYIIEKLIVKDKKNGQIKTNDKRSQYSGNYKER